VEAPAHLYTFRLDVIPFVGIRWVDAGFQWQKWLTLIRKVDGCMTLGGGDEAHGPV